jgi:GGDEF domain-containing protein
VLADEIVAFFKLNGLSEEEAQKATLALIDLGHFKLIGWTFDRKHAIIDIGEIQR